MNSTQRLTEIYYPESRFGGYTRVDGTMPFFNRVQTLLEPHMTVLDVGCGRGKAAERFDGNPWERCRVLKGRCQRVIGIDVDPVGAANPLIDEFRQLTPGEPWPVDSASTDLLISDAVLEHVPDPEHFFAEIHRVVKPGGFVCIRTPNRWSYASIVASIVPNRLHGRVVEMVQSDGRKAQDVFPTLYRANTLRALRRLMARHGLDGYAYRHISEPTFLQFSRPLYAVGVVVHRWLPSVFWPWMFLFARRLDDGEVQTRARM